MAKLLINEIKYKNFKGLTDFTLSLNGGSGVVSGQNGSGKTSLADGLLWLLFGKDSRGAKINPKPLDQKNQEKQGLEPTVEASLTIDGKQYVLKRVQEEKWTKPRGQLEEVRGSDTTKYSIDGVPKMEKEWKAFLDKIGPENILQMLFDSTYFMKMPWKSRREVLVNLSGLSDEKIIAMDPELKELPEILGDYTIDDFRKILVSRKKEIKKQIGGVPARIQEVTDMANNIKAKLAEFSQEELQEQILEHEADISGFEGKLRVLQSGNASLDYLEELSNLKVKLANAQSSFLASTNMEVRSLQEDTSKQQRLVNDLRNQKYELENKLQFQKNQVAETENFLENHRQKYHEIKNLTFDEHKTECAMCGQTLPANQVESMMAKFNQDKANKLEVNITEGKAAKEKLLRLQKEQIAIELDLENVASGYSAAENLLNQLNADLNYFQEKAPKFEDSDPYKKIQEEINLVQQKILNATTDTVQAEQELEAKITASRGSIAELQSTLLRWNDLKAYEDRINELKAEDKRLKEQNQDVERQLFLLDEFTRKKVRYLEESINSKFDLVKFKLFNILKNGGLEEVCEATYNGIEYGTSLNTGARINCDLDIINTLGREFGLNVPVFVDNTESVNQLHAIDPQTIELRVTKTKNLKVEV